MKKALFIAVLMLLFGGFVIAISSVGEARSCCSGMNGSIWGGLESQQGSELGGWIGGEVYFPWIFFSNHLALEIHSGLSIYDAMDLSATFGLRGIFSYWSAGVGAGVNLYDIESPRIYDKWYGWVSGYYPCFFSKAYFDITEGYSYGYGQFSAVIDIRTKPFGLEGSYLYGLKPGGKYKELRGDISLSLYYLGNICYENDCDFDFRVYLGVRIASFFNPTDLYRADWKGVLGGLRYITPDGELRFEIQISEKSDQYTCGLEGKLVLSGSFSF